ncbi:hypothetical protein SAMN04488066_11434 [Halorubrum aquaticum]|uniref:Uncharacterized protein n=1 Tax=Halorubrum aquaticum TaxID=387340 RepID=A0A1I3BP09_9EURY|nr:hypothetical protein [Halorubrum aquaticum]SFH64025.1 hypothetical protein SAMN04488066_11434 [Halorubrum aquaticum]
MNRRRFLAVAGTALAGFTAGCAGRFGDDEGSRLDLSVRNERSEPIDVRVEVVDDDGTTHADESDRLDPGVARVFEVVVGTDGRHELTASGDGWAGRLAWDAGTCARFDGTVTVADEAVEVAGECVDVR